MAYCLICGSVLVLQISGCSYAAWRRGCMLASIDAESTEQPQAIDL